MPKPPKHGDENQLNNTTQNTKNGAAAGDGTPAVLLPGIQLLWQQHRFTWNFRRWCKWSGIYTPRPANGSGGSLDTVQRHLDARLERHCWASWTNTPMAPDWVGTTSPKMVCYGRCAAQLGADDLDYSAWCFADISDGDLIGREELWGGSVQTRRISICKTTVLTTIPHKLQDCRWHLRISWMVICTRRHKWLRSRWR